MWLCLIEIYSNLFISKFGTSDSGTWFETLKDLTPNALENGIEMLRQGTKGHKFSEYPPNCLQFRALCLEYYEGLKLLSVSDAYAEYKRSVRTGKWRDTHRAVQYTAHKLGADFLMLDRDIEAYPLFKKTYLNVCHLARLGLEIPVVNTPLMLSKITSRESARVYLNNLKQHLGAPSC